MDELSRMAWVTVVIAVQAIPLGLSVWALLDCTRRPSWAWALCGRGQANWVAAILVGILVCPAGVMVSSWYLLRVRPQIHDAEQGKI